MVEYQCPHCKTVLQVPERFVGSRGKCRNCGNTITIEVAGVRNGAGGSSHIPKPLRPPTPIALHLVVTGPTSRKDSIIEVGAVKLAANGRVLDQFWSFANPDGPIPTAAVERTGITNDMVAAAPFPLDVLNDLFAWAGPNAIFFTEHAHLHAKFLCATYYRENLEPPQGRIVDVCNWAQLLELRSPEYRLRPLLGAIGLSVELGYRATESAQAIGQLLAHLMQTEAARLPKQDDAKGRGRLLSRKQEEAMDTRLGERLFSLASTLDAACGSKFHMREIFEERRRQKVGNGQPAAAGAPTPMILHMPEWYEEKKRAIEAVLSAGEAREPAVATLHAEDEAWAQAMVDATKSHDPDEQRRLLMQAVSLGARDPWPYERLTGFFIKSRDYLSAQKVCQRYFDGDVWKQPRHADSSWKLLDRMEKLERRLTGAA